MKRRPGKTYKSLIGRDAEHLGLTVEEYGVSKGSAGSVVKPVNSATGLLVISIVLTILMIGVLLAIGVYIRTHHIVYKRT